MRYFLACLLILFSSVFFSQNALAHSWRVYPKPTGGDIDEANFNLVPVRYLPSHPLYITITAKESFSRFFKPSSKEKAEFDLVLMGKRLKESYMLLEKGDISNASENLNRYKIRADKLKKQIEKAKNQNQSLTDVSDYAAGNLVYHETLIFAISNQWSTQEDSYNFDANFKNAEEAFIETVMVFEAIKPGIKNRYEIIKIIEEEKESETPAPSPTPTPFEGTPGSRPRRIIY